MAADLQSAYPMTSSETMNELRAALRARINAENGFTLIELMVAVAIVGVLVSVALPSYVEHVRRGKRSDAQSVLLESAQFMQRYYVAHNTFAGASLTGTGLDHVPKNASATDASYTVQLTVPSASNGRAYALTATPRFSDPKCGELKLMSTGQKLSAVGSTKDCWR